MTHHVLSDSVRDHSGRRSADEGSSGAGRYGTGGLNLLKPGQRTRSTRAARCQPRRFRASPIAPARSSSSGSPISPRSTASIRSSPASPKACWWRRRFRNGGRRQGPCRRSRRRQQSHDSRQAGRDARAVLNRTRRGPGAYRAVLDTSLGEITLSFTPDKAPMHVRNFLRLAQAGVYDGMSFHRVVKGFVIQSGHLPSRRRRWANAAEVRPADEGGVQRPDPREGHALDGAAGGPDTASTSFFIVTAKAQALDGNTPLWQGRERPRHGREDRGGGRERRHAGGARRAAESHRRPAVRRRPASAGPGSARVSATPARTKRSTVLSRRCLFHARESDAVVREQKPRPILFRQD